MLNFQSILADFYAEWFYGEITSVHINPIFFVLNSKLFVYQRLPICHMAFLHGVAVPEIGDATALFVFTHAQYLQSLSNLAEM